MKVTRRELVGALAAAAVRNAPAQPPRPVICLHSAILSKLHYSELGPTLAALGFEGCDLTVRRGGHVIPERAPADLLRAIEGITGEGVQVPMITTDLVSASYPAGRVVLAIAGGMRVPYFRLGYWPYSENDDIEARLQQVRRDVLGLSMLGRAYGMIAGFPNRAGFYVGASVWDAKAVVGELDPAWVGYCYDPCHATAEGGVGGWSVSLRLVLPRLKMITLRDFYWQKTGGKWQMTMCPMGEGMVDWPAVFSALAQARFSGPVSLHVDYNP